MNRVRSLFIRFNNKCYKSVFRCAPLCVVCILKTVMLLIYIFLIILLFSVHYFIKLDIFSLSWE